MWDSTYADCCFVQSWSTLEDVYTLWVLSTFKRFITARCYAKCGYLSSVTTDYYFLVTTRRLNEYLSLAKRDRVELVSFKSLVMSEFQQCHCRVGTVRQNENKWRNGARVAERLFQVKRRGFDETLSKFSRHIVCHRRNYLTQNSS